MTYYYCQCFKKAGILSYNPGLLILEEDGTKGIAFIYLVLTENYKLSFSAKDYSTIAKLRGGIELIIIKSI
jgi:hypothetical protein